MRIEFRVDGDLPPKKHGEQSMWGLPTESRRLVILRKAAFQALEGKPPLEKDIRLTLVVHVGAQNDRYTGDLDNFVTGVCDGLMAADNRSKLDEVWSRPELSEIHPSVQVAIVDDCNVVSIRADKVVGDTEEPWYQVIMEGD